MPASKGNKGGRPSKKEAELEKQLQEMREVAAQAKRKQVEMEQQLAIVMAQLQKKETPGTPVFSGSPVVQTPPTGIGNYTVVSGGSGGSVTPGDIALAYQHISHVYDHLSTQDQLARSTRENIMLRAAMQFAPRSDGNNGK